MILYFADRMLNIIGQASTSLPEGLVVTEDTKTEDIETGVSVFECKIQFDRETRALVEECTEVGNYILRSHEGENEFYQIVESETDTKEQCVSIYAEDDGMDLLNEVIGAYEADQAYPIDHYINKYAAGAGFEIGINEAKNMTRKLAWDGESTATERIASVAAQFGGCEISFSFEIDGLCVTKKYINIYKERGKDICATMRLNEDLDGIVTTKSIANLATALRCTGGTIDQESTVLEATSNGSPAVAYTLDLETVSRTKNSVKITATIAAALTAEDAKLGEDYGLQASVYMGGSWHNATIKATDKDNKQEWKGTTSHSTEITFTVSGVAAGVVTYKDIKFKVARTDSKGGSAGVLASASCGEYTIPNFIPGGENGENINSRSITLDGYEYNDGDFFVDGNVLKSKNALQQWSRLIWKTDESKKSGGHITKLYSYETADQKTLCEQAIAELKKLREMEVNYEIDITNFPENAQIGDRVNIVDDAGGLYISARILKLEESVTGRKHKAVIGEYLIKNSGISEKVAELAAKFAKNSASAARALAVAKNAKSESTKAAAQSKTAAESAQTALNAASSAQNAANVASESASLAQEKAEQARQAVDSVEGSVAALETTVSNAQAAAEQARQAAATAEAKASESQQAAANAQSKAEEVAVELTTAKNKADEAVTKSEEARSSAAQAIADASAASTTAAAAKLDAENAQKDIDSLGKNLTTLSNTMTADYARKTDLTEATANLQTQITQNAAGITSTATKVQEIDETANNAAEQAQAAQQAAEVSRTQAEQAVADALAAQQAADNAAALASSAQDESEAAKAAAEVARSVADKAEADLEAAKKDLETVTSRVDSTEEEIAAAQQAVTVAREVADKAKEDSEAATQKATAAREVADAAATNASDAQAVASDAASKANLAQQAAEAARGDSTAARQVAEQAAEQAAESQRIASAAAEQAAESQRVADQAVADAEAARQAASDADAKAAQAADDLATARQNLADVTSRVDATEEEVEAARQAVNIAQQAADKASQEAAVAQSSADTASANAATAHRVADEARNSAEQAAADAEAARQAAEKAQADVDALAVRVTSAETKITQTSEQIALMAKKTEVAEMLGGYSTKEEMQAAIDLKAEGITSLVSRTYATKDENEAAQSAADEANSSAATANERLTVAETLVQQLSNSIAMLVVDENGESMMTQTENGWQFSMKETASAVSGISELLKTLREDAGSIEAAVAALQQAVNDHGVPLEYVNITTYESEPCIELGESGSDFKLLITNTRIMFMNGSNIPTYIGTNGVVTQDITVQGEIVQGGYVTMNTADGGWGIFWKGVSS